MKPLRVGILGAGGIAARHAAAIAAHPEAATLVACCGRDPDKAAAFAAQHGGRAYADRERMLDEAALDILIVALPPFAHSDEVESAARRGIHLLLEKPIALDGDHADRMVAAAEAAGITTQVGFMGRFGTAVERWTELADAGATGRPGLYSARFHCNALHAPWWRERQKSGGQMVEQLIHMIDLARYFLGDPATVYARTATFFHRGVERYDSDDLSAMLLGYDDGRAGLKLHRVPPPGACAHGGADGPACGSPPLGCSGLVRDDPAQPAVPDQGLRPLGPDPARRRAQGGKRWSGPSGHAGPQERR